MPQEILSTHYSVKETETGFSLHKVESTETIELFETPEAFIKELEDEIEQREVWGKAAMVGGVVLGAFGLYGIFGNHDDPSYGSGTDTFKIIIGAGVVYG